MKSLVLLAMCSFGLFLTGCAAQVFDDAPEGPDKTTKQQILKGSWNFWMRMDTSSNNSLVKGTMVVQDEACEADVCQIAGLILKPQLATIGTRLNFTGIVVQSENLIRIQFNDYNNRNDPMLVIVEFDVFLQDFDPERTMVGHFVMFDQKTPGPLNEESSILVEADRGQLTTAGRVTAWPIVIKDPTLPSD